MKILLGSPARQDTKIFAEYLKALDKLILPCRADRFFVLNDADNLKPYLKPADYIEHNTGDFYKKNEQSHYWRAHNFPKMSDMRNMLIERTLRGGYDYLFMVDTDLILEPETLSALLAAKKDIIAEIFWTIRHPVEEGKWQVNCWDYDQDQTYSDSHEKWREPGVYRVGGTGACILIHRRVFESGVNYSPLYNIRNLVGEDRFFSVRAASHNFDLFIDTHYPALHLYRESDLKKHIGGAGYDRE